MIEVLIYTFLLSLSPLGEARVGITYAIINDVHIFWAFLIGLAGNMMAYPIMMLIMNTFNKKLWRFKFYKRIVVWLGQFAKKEAASKINKYGFWGLMIFVMVPLPGTGAYMGTIAAAIFKLDHNKAFLAISIGLVFSCIIVAVGAYYGNMGYEFLGR